MKKSTLFLKAVNCFSLLIFLSAYLPAAVFAETNVSGVISSDTTWTLANSPYVVTGGVLVSSGVTLTIQPGVIVKFNSGLSLQIDGALSAMGTSNQAITFTSNSASPSPGDWGYILFSDSSADAAYDGDGNYTGGSILEYAVIEFAGGASVSDNGAVRMNNAHPLLNDCTIRNNGASGIYGYNLSGNFKVMNSNITANTEYGISATGGTITISSNTISDNLYSGVYLNGDTVNIFSNTINNNMGSGIYTQSDAIIISNNTISNNTASGSCNDYYAEFGGGIFVQSSSGTISGNIIKDNTTSNKGGGGGIYVCGLCCSGGGCYPCGTITISNNIIHGNTNNVSGGGIENQHSTISITNNIISENEASSAGGISTDLFDTIDHNSIIGNFSQNSAAISIWSWISSSFNSNTVTGNKAIGTTPTYAVHVNSNPFLISLLFNNNNIFSNTTTYELWNDDPAGSAHLNATNNWWGTSSDSAIQAKIYDWFDDSTKGIVDYSPFATSIRTDAPISPPTGLTATPGTGQIALQWNSNPESDRAGYKVYWGAASGYDYSNVVDVGNVTNYTIAGLSDGTYFVAVTAYDSTYNPSADDPDTIVNENQTNGNESWYATEQSVQVGSGISVSVSTSCVPADTQTGLTFQTQAAEAGGNVQFEIVYDFNDNGTIDGDEWSWQRYNQLIADNGSSSGPYPADSDPSAANISTTLWSCNGCNRYRSPGSYIVRVTNSLGQSAEAEFCVTPISAPQTVTGTVYVQGTTTPAPNASVLARDAASNAFIAEAYTDNNGGYTLQIPSDGDVQVRANKAGYLQTIPQVVAAGAANADLFLIPADIQITGAVTEYGTGAPIWGVRANANTIDGMSNGAVTNLSGDFVLPVLAGEDWEVNAVKPSGYFAMRASTHDYLQSPIITPSIPGPNVVNFIAHRETAWIEGTVKDEYGTKVVEGALFVANRINTADPALQTLGNGHYTDVSGNVTVGLEAGDWRVGLCMNCHQHPVKIEGAEKEMVPPAEVDVLGLTNGEHRQVDLQAYYADGAVEGRVFMQDCVTPVTSGVRVQAWTDDALNGLSQTSVGNIFTQTETDDNGYYRLPLLGGSWSISAHMYEWNKQSAEQIVALVSDGNEIIDQPGETVAGIDLCLDLQIYGPNITVDPLSHDFGSINIGSSSTAKTFAVSNTGSEDLVVGSISLTGDGIFTCQAIDVCPVADPLSFAILSDGCSGHSVAASESCQIQVVFAPKSAGGKVASLRVSSNDSDNPILDIQLYGAAKQTQYDLTINKTSTGSGKVTSIPSGILCGPDCTEKYNYGTVVTLIAESASVSTFGGWTGCGGVNGLQCTVTVDAAKTVTASFTKLTNTQPQLDLGSAGGNIGGKVQIPVILINAEGTDIASTSVDIGFDASALESPTASIGTAGSAAGKTVASNVVSPGVFRVGVLSSSNNNVIGDGVVAMVTFAVKAGASLGSTTLDNTPSASDPSGINVPVGGADGVINVSNCKPGDCDCNGTVSIAETQSAINMFLAKKAADACCDSNGDGVVSIGELQAIINNYLGIVPLALNFRALDAGLAAVASNSVQGEVPSLDLGVTTGNPGDTITVTVTLKNTSGYTLSALSSDVTFDSNLLENPSVTIGPAGTSAGKEIISNETAPGAFRIGIYSLANNSSIGDGVVATLSFKIKSGTSNGIAVLVNNPSGAGPSGVGVAMKGSNGLVNIGTLFSDVPAGYWSESFINAMMNTGITSGCGSENYCPDTEVSRMQMAVFLLKAMGEAPASSCTNKFGDVDETTGGNPAFCKYIEKFSTLGITAGCGNNNFCPNDPVSRMQMAVFITKALGEPMTSICGGTFNDVDETTGGNAAFCKYIEKFSTLGITAGCGTNNYCPDSSVTRAQMAVFLTKGFLQ